MGGFFNLVSQTLLELRGLHFIHIFQTDYYKILNDGESNQRRYEEDGNLVLVTETENAAKDRGHKVL